MKLVNNGNGIVSRDVKVFTVGDQGRAWSQICVVIREKEAMRPHD